MQEIYDPLSVLQNEICEEVCKTNDLWQLKQIKRFIVNIKKED